MHLMHRKRFDVAMIAYGMNPVRNCGNSEKSTPPSLLLSILLKAMLPISILSPSLFSYMSCPDEGGGGGISILILGCLVQVLSFSTTTAPLITSSTISTNVFPVISHTQGLGS